MRLLSKARAEIANVLKLTARKHTLRRLKATLLNNTVIRMTSNPVFVVLKR